MMTTRRWIIAALICTIGFVFTVLFIQHARDSHREEALIAKHQEIRDDSLIRVAVVARTDTLSTRLDSAIHVARVADSSWHAATASATTSVQTIIHSTKPDTIKIKELVYQVDTLIMKGDTLAKRGEALADTLAKFRVSVSLERSAWKKERDDLNSALNISEAMHRHWGFGCAGGGGLTRAPSGQIIAGPSVTCGIAYRL